MEEELNNYKEFKKNKINFVFAAKFSEILNIDTRDIKTFEKFYKFNPIEAINNIIPKYNELIF